ncbi:MAG TPA: glycosyltransferase [Bryobacteraceae bacterium]
MHILIFTVGSSGDVFPFVALGLELQRRGHTVTFMTGDHYETAVRKTGLDFSALFTAQEFSDILEHPDVAHPIRNIRLVYRQLCLPWVSRVYDVIAKHNSPGETAVVASAFVFGARIAQEKLRVPTATVHLQPTFLRSIHDTPVYHGFPIRNLPSPLKSVLYRGMDWFLDGCVAKELNAFRGSLGLAPLNRFFANWINSPDCTLGLFPKWFAPPQTDWPAQVRLTGFPLFDGAEERPLPDQLSQFLDAGEPPVVLTAGSQNNHGRWFFEAAVEACKQIGCRGLLVSAFPDQVPENLPDGLLHVPFVPFNAVFRRGRVAVHHGGIGTMAPAFAAGIPQIAVPSFFDQPDNAARLERLGAGLRVARKDFSGQSLADALGRVLREPVFARKARELSHDVDGPKAVAESCDVLEQAFRRGRPPYAGATT